MAQEARRIGASHRHLGRLEHLEAFLDGAEQLGGVGAVHGASQVEKRSHAQGQDQVEQGVGPLVAEQERIAFVLRSADQVGMCGVDVLAEEIMGHDGWHGCLLRRMQGVPLPLFCADLTGRGPGAAFVSSLMIYNCGNVSLVAPQSLRTFCRQAFPLFAYGSLHPRLRSRARAEGDDGLSFPVVARCAAAAKGSRSMHRRCGMAYGANPTASREKEEGSWQSANLRSRRRAGSCTT